MPGCIKERGVSPEWLKQIQVLVWDFDGTFYQSIPEMNALIHERVFELIAQNKGVSVEEAEGIYKQMYSELHSATKVLIACGVDELYALSGQWSEDTRLNFLVADPKLVAMFDQLPRGLRYLIHTNGTREATQKKLAALGLDPAVFAIISCPTDYGKVKPDPSVFAAILERTGLPAGAHLYIGDRDKTDLEPARELGIHTCLVWGESEIADISLGSVYDVEKILT